MLPVMGFKQVGLRRSVDVKDSACNRVRRWTEMIAGSVHAESLVRRCRRTARPS
jgi:hypothetical protein